MSAIHSVQAAVKWVLVDSKEVQAAISVCSQQAKKLAQYWFCQLPARFADAAPARLRPEMMPHTSYPNPFSESFAQAHLVDLVTQYKCIIWLSCTEQLSQSNSPQNGVFLSKMGTVLLSDERYPKRPFLEKYVLEVLQKEEAIPEEMRQYDFFCRVAISRGLRGLIEEKKWTHLYAPQKWLVKSSTIDQYYVLAEHLDLMSVSESRSYFLAQSQNKQRKIIEQLYSLMLDSGYNNGFAADLRFIRSGKLAGKLALFNTALFQNEDTIDFFELFESDPQVFRSLSILGWQRSKEINYGKDGIALTFHDQHGLNWNRDLMKQIWLEMREKINQEEESIRTKSTLWSLCPTATMTVTLIAGRLLIA